MNRYQVNALLTDLVNALGMTLPDDSMDDLTHKVCDLLEQEAVPAAPKPHDGHDLQYRMNGVTTSQPCRIKPNGWVQIIGPTFEIERIDGDNFVVCLTCDERLRSGEDGLADDWEAE